MNLNKNIIRNVSPLGLSWLVNCLMQGSLRISLAFLNLIMLSLRHGSTIKNFNYRTLYPGNCTTIRYLGVFLSSSHGENLCNVTRDGGLRKSSVAFFVTTTLPSVLWLSRSTKKGRNFSKQTVIGSGRMISAQNVAGVWGVCWHGATLLHSQQI